MTQALSILQLCAAFCLILGVVFVSKALCLELERSILLAATRSTLQLFVLGYVLLVPIFAAKSALLVLAYLVFVIFVAAHEASSKPSFLYESLYIHALVAIGGSALMILAFTVAFVLCPHPWWEPQYLIPVAGMVVGNSISSFSLALGRFLSAIKQRSSEIELRLALGASRFDAALPLVREACVAGLTPNLNQMSVVGLVSIPGMMTGQILGGQPPGDAARYQLMILFVICATCLCTMVLGLGLATATVFDDQHRLAADANARRTLKQGAAAVDAPADAPEHAQEGGRAPPATPLLARVLGLGPPRNEGLWQREGAKVDVVVAAFQSLARQLSDCWGGLSGGGRRRRGYDAIGDDDDRVRGGGAAAAGVPGAAEPSKSMDATAEVPQHRIEEGRDCDWVDVCPIGDGQLWGLQVTNLTVAVPCKRTAKMGEETGSGGTGGGGGRGDSAMLGGGERLLVHDLSFTVQPGEVVAVMGRNGTGKSKLLRALAGLDPVPLSNQAQTKGAPRGAVALKEHRRGRTSGGGGGGGGEGDSAHFELPLTRTFGHALSLPSLLAASGVGQSERVGSGVGGEALFLPWWRSKVCHVPQDVPAFLGSPLDLLRECASYDSRQKGSHEQAAAAAADRQTQQLGDLPTLSEMSEHAATVAVDLPARRAGLSITTPSALPPAPPPPLPLPPPPLPPPPPPSSSSSSSGATEKNKEALKTVAAAMGLREECTSQPWRELSGGERQRALLAVVLALGPPAVLLLDEPTSAADAATAAAVEACLASFRLATVWVTHDEAQAARVASRVIRLSSSNNEGTP